MAELKNRNQLERSRYCPSCGAGWEPHDPTLPEGVAAFRVHKDYPFNAPCQECEERFQRGWEKTMRELRERIEKKVLDKIVGDG